MKTPRPDFFMPIHKGIRYGAANLMIQLGNTDWADAVKRTALLADIRSFPKLASRHSYHEDVKIFPHLLVHAPGLTGQPPLEHMDHEITFVELERAINELEVFAS